MADLALKKTARRCTAHTKARARRILQDGRAAGMGASTWPFSTTSIAAFHRFCNRNVVPCYCSYSLFVIKCEKLLRLGFAF